MASFTIPLARRPRWQLLVLVPLLGLFLPASLFSALTSPKAFPNAELIGVLYALACAGSFYWHFTSLAVADYDADYLHLFQKSGATQIPLGSFYKLAAARGYWQLYYLDAQQRQRKLQVVPLNTGWFGQDDNSSIHGFIAAVGQHNPNLDVRHGWFR